MTSEGYYRLCGGTFFVLLSDARKPLLSKDENYNGKKSGITEVELLIELMRIVIPDFVSPSQAELKSFTNAMGKFKSCQTWGGGYLRLNDASVIASFKSRIKNEFQDCLDEMTKLSEKFLEINTDAKKDEYLIKALVEVILNDKGISDNQLLYICKNGKPITKSELRNTTEICFQSFLLGIWHFAVTGIKENSIGRKTYEEWCPPHNGSKGSKREYVAAIGENSSLNIHLSYYENDHLCDEPSDDVDKTENTAETIETEIIDEVKNDDTTAQYIDNSVMVNIGNGLQIKENHGTLNIVLGK